MPPTIQPHVLGKLREAVARMKGSPVFKEIVEPRDGVFARFQPVFAPEKVPQITAEAFKDFLSFENNHHWTGLHRQGGRICKDMGKLHTALKILTDESEPIAARLDKSIDMITGMGRNIATAILLVGHPDKYGVWNTRSEANLKQLGIWPQFERSDTFGKQYAKVNQVLLVLRDELQIDLWTLDALWWFLDQQEAGAVQAPGAVLQGTEQGFGLERHLHEFLFDNWDRIDLGKDWAIHGEPGDLEAGYEYPCEIGRIDLLAKHRTEPVWLVIELKRDQTSDQTVGQVLRYMGWVRQNLAEDGEDVKGMIICRESDKALRYALSTQPDIQLRQYEVEFRLGQPVQCRDIEKTRGRS